MVYTVLLHDTCSKQFSAWAWDELSTDAVRISAHAQVTGPWLMERERSTSNAALCLMLYAMVLSAATPHVFLHTHSMALSIKAAALISCHACSHDHVTNAADDFVHAHGMGWWRLEKEHSTSSTCKTNR